MKKVVIISNSDPKDKKSWSGIPYSIYQQLSKYYIVDTKIVNYDKILKIEVVIYKLLIFLKGTLIFGIVSSYLSSKKTKKILNNNRYDFAFVFGAPNTAFVDKVNIPIIYYTDTTYNLMINYYWKNSYFSDSIGNYIQHKSLRNNTINLAASTWAYNDMINHYGIDRSKCVVCSFGANVDVKQFNQIEHSEYINLVFIGVVWERKGGDIAIDCFRNLKALDKNHHYKLHIVGSNPTYTVNDNDIIFYGFLDRNDKKQNDIMTDLINSGDIFLLPTKAECAGIVFCEASAYGLPIVTYDTGGIPDYVINGYNGYRLPLDKTGKDFANKIIEIVSDSEKLKQMKANCRQIYNEKLNWDATGNIIHSIAERLI